MPVAGLQNSRNYIDEVVTKEYEFQRDRLYASRTPSHINVGMTLIAALAVYVMPSSLKHPNDMFGVFLISFGRKLPADKSALEQRL
jgi:hypothetical protein